MNNTSYFEDYEKRRRALASLTSNSREYRLNKVFIECGSIKVLKDVTLEFRSPGDSSWTELTY